MGVLDDAAQTTTSNQQTTETEKSFVEQLVEKKGESWKDIETIAKGKIESDNYIQQLELQLEELRTDLGKQDFASQVLEQLRGGSPGGTKETPKTPEQGTSQQGNTNPKAEETDVKDLVTKLLAEQEAVKKAKENQDKVDSKLKELFGDEAPRVIAKKTQELGISLDDLKELAAKSPEAFLSLVAKDKVAGNSSVINSNVNTSSSLDGQQKRNFAYYQKMRKENRKQYYSPSIQQQILRDRQSLGDAFYN